MAVVRLKGLNRVRKRLKDGREVVYWYAWKGGPKLEGKLGSPEFVASYNRAVADRKSPRNDTLAGLVAQYRASPEYAKLSDTTKRHWARWLDRVADTSGPLEIGSLGLAMLDDRRVKEDLLEWRDQWAATPRTADYAVQVLSRILSWGVSRGKLAINAAAGIEQLYESDRADQIWTADEEALYCLAAPSPEVAFIVPLANLTGLRREDLTRLSWSHVGEAAIVLRAGKSEHRGREAKDVVVPVLGETRELLGAIKAQQERRHAELCAVATRKKKPAPPKPLTVLSNTRGKPWTVNGLEHQVIDAKGSVGIDKHLHDARGTFGTRLRKAGLRASEIADILGWEERRVERLLATYVDRDAIVRDLAERIRENESRGKIPN